MTRDKKHRYEKKERRKERQRIARHLNEATLFSMHVSEIGFGSKFAEITRYINDKWKKNLTAIILLKVENNTAKWSFYKSEEWNISDAAMHASVNQKLQGKEELPRITESMASSSHIRDLKNHIGI